MIPDVSVLVPCYNCELTLARAVRSALDQKGVSVEVIIVDDASTDNTWQVIKSLCGRAVQPDIALDVFSSDKRIRGTKQLLNLRIAETLNTAAMLSDGRYLMRLDSDDWLNEGALARMVAALDANPDVSFVYGGRKYYGRRSDTYMPRPFNADDFNVHNASGYAYMFRREVWDEGLRWRALGTFNGVVVDLEDWQHVHAMLAQGRKGLALTDTLTLHYVYRWGTTFDDLQANHDAALAEFKARYPTVRATQL